MAEELPSYSPSSHTVAAPLTSLLYNPLHIAKDLTTIELRYAKIEKSAWLLLKPQQLRPMAFGKIQHTVHTDHQPLQSIFDKNPASAPKRLQKMMLFPQHYNFTVVCRKGYFLHLEDTISRTPCQDEANTPSMPDTFHVFHVHLVHLDLTSAALTDTTREQLHDAITSCPDMHLLLH